MEAWAAWALGPIQVVWLRHGGDCLKGTGEACEDVKHVKL